MAPCALGCTATGPERPDDAIWGKRMVTIAADKLRALVRDIFISAGCSRAESERLGKSLVSANLTGHDSHGVVRVPRYLEWKAEGAFLADQKVKVLHETPVLAVV